MESLAGTVKRFTATEKWDKAWFRALSIQHKCLWLYLCDKSDPAGVWEPDFELASFQIGTAISEADFSAFGDRIEKLPSGKYWLKAFVEFQYGKLSNECPPHKTIIQAVRKHGLENRLDLPTNYPKARVALGVRQDKTRSGQDQDCRGSVEGEVLAKPDPNRNGDHDDRAVTAERIEAIWDLYPLKVAKPSARDAIANAIATDGWKRVLAGTRAYKQVRGDNRSMMPHPATFFEQARYNDDPSTWMPRRDKPKPKSQIEKEVDDVCEL